MLTQALLGNVIPNTNNHNHNNNNNSNCNVSNCNPSNIHDVSVSVSSQEMPLSMPLSLPVLSPVNVVNADQKVFRKPAVFVPLPWETLRSTSLTTCNNNSNNNNKCTSNNNNNNINNNKHLLFCQLMIVYTAMMAFLSLFPRFLLGHHQYRTQHPSTPAATTTTTTTTTSSLEVEQDQMSIMDTGIPAHSTWNVSPLLQQQATLQVATSTSMEVELSMVCSSWNPKQTLPAPLHFNNLSHLSEQQSKQHAQDLTLQQPLQQLQQLVLQDVLRKWFVSNKSGYDQSQFACLQQLHSPLIACSS
jgi:hypothetical protein